jgi:hypothetical protein
MLYRNLRCMSLRDAALRPQAQQRTSSHNEGVSKNAHKFVRRNCRHWRPTCQVFMRLVNKNIGANDAARQAKPWQEALVAICYDRMSSPSVLCSQSKCHRIIGVSSTKLTPRSSLQRNQFFELDRWVPPLCLLRQPAALLQRSVHHKQCTSPCHTT